ncbi:MAG: methyltransferase domain-containing protein [Nitrospirales bacterium]|nr:methyltransferase domain-containing protein [Nitrospirales bacterium]
MSTSDHSQAPSPALFFQTVNAYQRTAALKTAIELELFTAIAEGNSVPVQLAHRCETSERGIRLLADYLIIGGFLTKQGIAYALTQDSALFLDRHSPAYMGGAMEFMLSSPLREGFQHLTRAVKKGGTAIDAQGIIAPEHPEWVRFARSMMPLMQEPAEWMAKWVCEHAPKTQKVLDVAAGHGIFGVEMAKKLPMVEVVAQDWANVLTVAQEQAAAAGVINRFRMLPGSAFDVEFGEGYDLVLLTNFLHHFDVGTCEALLTRVHACLADSGRVMTLEFVPNEDRVSPPAMAEFGLTMLAITPAGDAYSFAEYDRMFRQAGFVKSIMHDVPASNERVIITQK